MAGAPERTPFIIVIREVVNNFVSKRSPHASAVEGEVTAEEPAQTSDVPEPDTLFDDSDPYDWVPKAGGAADQLRVRAENNNKRAAPAGTDDDDDAIFSGIVTQNPAQNEVDRDLRDRSDDPNPLSDKRSEPILKNAFVTAGGKSLKVSEEALRAVKKKLEDEGSPPTRAPPRTEVRAGFDSGVPAEVSQKASTRRKKVSAHDGPLAELHEDRLEPAREDRRDLSEMQSSHEFIIPSKYSAAKKEAPLIGFTTARGTATKVSERALREIRQMLDEVSSEVADGDGQTMVPTEKAKTLSAPGFSSARAKSPESSLNHFPGGSSLGFTTAPEAAQEVSEESAREARVEEELLEPIGGEGGPHGTGDGKKPLIASGFSTARGESVSVSRENIELARKIFEEAGDDPEESSQQTKDCTPSGSRAAALGTKLRRSQKEEAQDSKTPARRIAGLKRRSPMCHTPLNRLSSPITPLRTPASTGISTPIRTLQIERHPLKKARVLGDIEENVKEVGASKKIQLAELTLLNRCPAMADSSWFRDDVSGRRVHLEDVKRSFRREINVRSSNFDSWFANHFEMVVWKLANYSGRVKELAGCLVIENVLDQLKHRWSLEHEGKRSPLKMIAERDAPPEPTMVLLVKDVRPNSLILTDGWYSLPCDVDTPLQTLISKGSLRPGQKICVCGAQLKGAPNGVDPLEPVDARLSIHFNSTRRARWYAKMGYLRKSLLVPLTSIVLNGGCSPAIRVRVSSSSPLMFFEKLPQGGSVMRQESAERKEQRKFSEKMSTILEKIHEEVSKELELELRSKPVTRTRSRPKPPVASLGSGEEIFKALENSLDPSQLMESLSSTQRRMLENHRALTEEKFRARLGDETRRRLEEMRLRHECPQERVVAPLLKLMVCCSLSNIEVPLTVWRPSEDLRSMLRVGATVTIYKANVTTCRKSPFGLTTTNKTNFEIYDRSSE